MKDDKGTLAKKVREKKAKAKTKAKTKTKERYGLEMVPDCADLVMFLRQYFAWKLNLPIGRYRCSGRGIYNRDCEADVLGNEVTVSVEGLSKDARTSRLKVVRRYLEKGPGRGAVGLDKEKAWLKALRAQGMGGLRTQLRLPSQSVCAVQRMKNNVRIVFISAFLRRV